MGSGEWQAGDPDRQQYRDSKFYGAYGEKIQNGDLYPNLTSSPIF